MNNKILFGIMTIIFNWCGVPCFMTGKVGAGIWRIVFAVVPCLWILMFITWIMGIVKGIKILCMSDEDFAAVEDKATLLSGIPSGKPKAEKAEETTEE